MVIFEGAEAGRTVFHEVMKKILSQVVVPTTVDLDDEDLQTPRQITFRVHLPDSSNR